MNHFDNDFENAKILYNQKNYVESERKFNYLLKNGNNIGECYYYIGLIKYNNNMIDKAEHYFLKSLDSEATNYNSCFLLGKINEVKGNKDLALFYFSKTLKLSPGHAAAKRAEAKILGTDNVGKNTVPPVLPKTHSNEEVDNEPRLGDVFDQFKDANNSASQVVVNSIRNTRIIERRPRLSAYLSSFFTRIILSYIITFIVSWFFFGYNHDISMSIIVHLTPLALVIYVLLIIYKIIKIKSTVVTIDRGNIIVKEGIIFRPRQIFPIYKAESFGSSQGLFNRITNDGVLAFRMPNESFFIRLKGLAKYKDIEILADQLQSLHLQIRSTDIGKGIMN